MTAPSVRTCLWFESGAEEAATFYCTLFDDAEITGRFAQQGDPSGGAFLVQWRMADQAFTAMNGGPHYKLSPAASIEVHVDTQAEVDRLWDALTANGGEESRCGWLVDRFGVSWQIIPRPFLALMQSKEPGVAGRVMQAMLQLKKLDMAVFEAAARGD